MAPTHGMTTLDVARSLPLRSRAAWRQTLLMAARLPILRMDLQFRRSLPTLAVLREVEDFMNALGRDHGSIPWLAVTESNQGRPGHHAHVLAWASRGGRASPTPVAISMAWERMWKRRRGHWSGRRWEQRWGRRWGQRRHSDRRGSSRAFRLWDDPDLPAAMAARLFREEGRASALRAMRASQERCPRFHRTAVRAIDYALKHMQAEHEGEENNLRFSRHLLQRIGASGDRGLRQLDDPRPSSRAVQ